MCSVNAGSANLNRGSSCSLTDAARESSPGPASTSNRFGRETQPAKYTQPGVGQDCFRLGLGELVCNLNVQPLGGNSNSAVVAPDHQPDVLGTRQGPLYVKRPRHVGGGLDNQPVRILKCLHRLPWYAHIRSYGFGAEALGVGGEAAVVWCDLDSDNVIENLD